jgi:hypothetical protein
MAVEPQAQTKRTTSKPTPAETDALVNQARRGDREAFVVLAQQNLSRLYRFVSREHSSQSISA